MDDDDEFDNFFSVIDDAAAIAALDHEEKKIAATATQRVVDVEHSPPPKRQKLDHRTESASQYAQLPIMLGLEDDYFTRTNAAPLRQRNEDARSRPPLVKQNLPHPPDDRPSALKLHLQRVWAVPASPRVCSRFGSLLRLTIPGRCTH